MIFYGSKASTIGHFQISDYFCEYCENECDQEITVFGRYAHVYWIPLFPLGKKVFSECTHCKRTLEQKEFPYKLNQLIYTSKNKASRPFWHWLGLIFVGAFILLMVLVGLTETKDARKDMLQNDLQYMTSSPTMESDSISYKIKQVFDEYVLEELNPDEFEYFTKIQDDKALVLVKIPKLKTLEKTVRPEVLELIEVIIDDQQDMIDKEKYIGLMGARNFMVVKTPHNFENRNIVLEQELFGFYGKNVLK